MVGINAPLRWNAPTLIRFAGIARKVLHQLVLKAVALILEVEGILLDYPVLVFLECRPEGAIGFLIERLPQVAPLFAVQAAGWPFVMPFAILFSGGRLGDLLGRRLVQLFVHLVQRHLQQRLAGLDHLPVSQLFGLPGVPVEACRNEEKRRTAKEEPALALEAGFTQQTFECSVGHFRPHVRFAEIPTLALAGFWQCGQKCVDLPARRMRSIAVWQRGHG